MTHTGPLGLLPIACTLTPNGGSKQLQRWRVFDDNYALDIDRTATRLVVHYARVDDSLQQLRDLVATESDCCSFVNWVIDDSHTDLRLIVTGFPGQLAALNVG